MRLVRILVSHEKRGELVAILEEEKVDYVTYETEAPADSCLVEFPLPVGVVDDVLETVRERGIDVAEYTVVTSLETATTRHLEELEQHFVEESDEIRRISHAELRVEAQEQKPGVWTFVVLAALSAMVAAAGLLLDSAIVITGAMVLAPFLGSLVSGSVGFAIHDRDLILEAVRHQPLGFGVAIAGGGVAALLFKWLDLVPSILELRSMDQIASFSTPNALVGTIAIIAGVAVALTVATDISSAFAGIAAAAAIVPSAATVGIGLVWHQPAVAFDAFVLLLLNVTAINVVAYVTFFALGYRSGTIREIQPRLDLSLRTTGIAVVTVLGVLVLGTTVFASYSYVSFQQTVNREVEDVLQRPAYDDLAFVEVRADHDLGLFDREAEVTVVVASGVDHGYPALADRLRRAIAARVDRQVSVRVRFIEYQRASRTVSSRRRTDFTPAIGRPAAR